MHYLLLFVGILFLIFSVFILNIPALNELDLQAVEWMRSPTAHREAETAKAHRG